VKTPTLPLHDHSNSFASPTESSPGAPQAASSPQKQCPTRKRTPTKDNLKIAIINCQSLKNKTAELQLFIEDTDPDLILGTESWLKPEISNSEIFPPGNNVFRRDRTLENKKTGGGVFILARKEFVCSEVHLETNCKLVMMELHLIDQ